MLLFFIFSIQGFTQDIPIKTKLERILVKNDTSFVNTISVSIKKSDKALLFPIFYDTELESVSNIKVYKKRGNRFKLIKTNVYREEAVELDYITSKKVKSIIIPSETETKITYTIKCKQLMYLSSLPFFSYNDIDTLKYHITVPNNFHFVHNTIYKDSLKYMAIDSTRLDSLTTWKIEVEPIKVEPDPLLIFGIYKNIKKPLMRTLIIPHEFIGNEKKYMNDWYLHKVETKRGLNQTVIHKIDELTKGVSDPMEIMDILYSYVKSNFKYVAVEIGMGAFVPTHANEVFTYKQGDCKDLSNFLSEALNSKGIKSNIALAATYNHISDCDFPSLSSANHVICVTYINDKLILLDPTDPIHFPETPVQSLQNRSIFIINSNGGEFYKVNGFTPQQNLINYEIALELNSNELSLEGIFKANYKGISGNFLKRELMYLKDSEVNNFGKKYFESVFGNLSISNFKLNNHRKGLYVEGTLFVNGKILKDDVNWFLFIDFLPNIFETVKRESLLVGTHLGSPFSKKVNLRIKMDKPFDSFSPIEHTFSNKGISLSLKISNPSELIIVCEYEFVFNYITIDQGNQQIINEILESFKKITNVPIIFKKSD